MKIKGLVDEDFVNYKLPSMFIATSKCTFKCDKECGQAVCQNLPLVSQPIIEISNDILIHRYLGNPISEAIVIGGLEPFDDFEDLYKFIDQFRSYSYDDIVIYTGYYEDEIQPMIDRLKLNFENIIVKFGRYIPNQKSHYDEILGVMLASDNQRGIKIC